MTSDNLAQERANVRSQKKRKKRKGPTLIIIKTRALSFNKRRGLSSSDRVKETPARIKGQRVDHEARVYGGRKEKCEKREYKGATHREIEPLNNVDDHKIRQKRVFLSLRKGEKGDRGEIVYLLGGGDQGVSI